jgi:hypothetical protein
MNLIYKNTKHGYDVEIIGLSEEEKENILCHFREMNKDVQVLKEEDTDCNYRSPNMGLCQIDGNQFRPCSTLCWNESCPKKERRKM